MKHFTIFFILPAMALQSCKEEPPDNDNNVNTEGKYNLTLVVNHQFAGNPLTLTTGEYFPTDDTISISKLRYHINNFYLLNSNGDKTPIDGYYLVDEEQSESKQIVLKGIPVATYTAIGFEIGVGDSMLNVTGGISNQFIDPMFWGMDNGGYINFKIEGNSVKAPQGAYVLHIGGYVGSNKTAQSTEIPTAITVENGSDLNRNLNVDLSLFFDGVNTLDLAMDDKVHMPGAKAVSCAQNIPGMFSISND